MPRKIIFIVIVLLIVFGLFYWFALLGKPAGAPSGGPVTEDTNFVSEFFSNIVNNIDQGVEDVITENVFFEEDVSTNENEIDGLEAPKEKLYVVSSMPVAGYTIFEKERFVNIPPPEDQELETPESTTKPTPPGIELVSTLRYVSKINGEIYQTELGGKERRYAGTLIPGVVEAFFAKNGESVVLRYAKDMGKNIATYVATLPKEILGGDVAFQDELKGVFLPDNITTLTTSPDGSRIFYIYRGQNAVVGMVANSYGGDKVQVFDSQFAEWNALWVNQNLIRLNSKPSGVVAGYAYGINPNKKDLNKILGGINGLVSLPSPNGKKILYSNNFMDLKVLDTETKQSKELDLQTLADKCVWGKDNDTIYCMAPALIDSKFLYPDNWYQGEITTKDLIWKISLSAEKETLLFNPSESAPEITIDAKDVKIDTEERNIFFLNKSDSRLWAFRLK